MSNCMGNTAAKFSTYAYYYVLGEVTKYIREDRTVKISRDYIKLNQSIEKARDLLRQKLLREPTDLEEEKMMLAKNATMYVKSLDEMVDSDEKLSYYNCVQVYDKEMDSSIMDLNEQLGKLTEEDKKIIYDRYYKGYTQSEVSKNMGISQVQVSRKEAKVLEKLKVRL